MNKNLRTVGFILSFIILSFCLPDFSNADPGMGEEIFKKICAKCHKNTEQTYIAPGLKRITKRRSVEWLDKWLKDPEGMIRKGDPAAKEVMKKGEFTRPMPTIKEMKDYDKRAAVIEYLKTLE